MRRTGFYSCLWALVLFSLAAASARADVTLPTILTDHMVLQRNAPVHIWGWAAPAEQVGVEFRGETRSTTANDIGQWEVDLSPGEAGGPFTLTVRGSNKVKLDDILVGDLWVASGQSNMELPLKGFNPATPVKDGEKEIAAARYPQIRYTSLARVSSEFPLDDARVSHPWQAVSPETAGDLSAAAYFFARDLQAVEKVPIGLVVSVWGGTGAEAWTSLRTLTSDPALSPVLAAYEQWVRNRASVLRRIEMEKAQEAKKPGQSATHTKVHSLDMGRPAGLFNAMIAPLTPLRIKGVIWYQGEQNANHTEAPLYARLFPAMIADWRQAWKQGDFPFLFVQLPNLGGNSPTPWSVLREAQRRTLAVANTAMVVSVDVGDAKNIHPPDKQDIGARLALAARALAYGEKVEFSGPALRKTTLEPEGLRVWFDHANGLTAHGDLLGFEVAGADHKFSPASARIDGQSVVVGSPAVARPVYVRYDWASNPPVTLFNQEGLPAAPFNSDDNYASQDGTSK